jgi:sugar phosphate isomerase/epimerase
MRTGFSRRDVLRSGAAAAVSMAIPSWVRSAEVKKLPIGLELYSVRNQLPADFTGTIEAIGKMGYQGVEFAGYYGWDKKPSELRKLLDDNGLKCCGTHTALNTLQGDNLKRTIELHKTLGNKFLICPQLSGRTAQRWLDNAKMFNEISQRAGEQGMLVGYHSHAPDFRKYDGKTAWEIFFDNTRPEVVHQIDVGNTLDGGGDPIAMIKRYPGRTKTTHLKEHGGGPDAPIGEGKIDWNALLATYDQYGGTEWYIVEHETSHNPLKTVKECLDNLHKMGR